jgi:hypothetical protein
VSGQELSLTEALPELARVAADAWVKTAWWSLAVSLRVGSRLARVALDPAAALELAEQFSAGMRQYAREFLGISDLDDRVRQLAPPSGSLSRRGRRESGAAGNGSTGSATGAGGHAEELSLTLRAQGAELLRRAADVQDGEEVHPAYARILAELAPDEARILRLLATDGPQPVVDVRAANLIGVGSQLVLSGLNMIGAQAGVARRTRVPAYLNNLTRLGLTRTAAGPLEDGVAYQVLEAQPDVLAAIKRTARAKTDRRRIELTEFGQDFCQVCLPLEADAPQPVG